MTRARSRLPSPEDAARLASLLSMMADPVRLRLVCALDVVEEPSYALRLLRTAGLAVTRKHGRVVFNRLAADLRGTTACAGSWP